MQQYLPLAVLKLSISNLTLELTLKVATVLTACGIETKIMCKKCGGIGKVATVLTACGIETESSSPSHSGCQSVATVLTAYGIE